MARPVRVGVRWSLSLGQQLLVIQGGLRCSVLPRPPATSQLNISVRTIDSLFPVVFYNGIKQKKLKASLHCHKFPRVLCKRHAWLLCLLVMVHLVTVSDSHVLTINIKIYIYKKRLKIVKSQKNITPKI